MNLKRLTVVAGVVVLWAAAVPTRAQQPRTLDISFNDGRVTLVAENVTLREILQEWARKGGSTIVNLDKVTGNAVPRTEFTNQPEAEVMATLLRELPGYGASMRAASAPGTSAVKTVYIMAARSVTPIPSGFYSQPAAPTVAPVVNANDGPQAPPSLLQGSPDSEIPPVRQIFEGPPGATPGTPGAAPEQPQTPPNPNLRVGPGGMVTSTVPGVIIPVQPAGPGSTPPTTPPTGGRGRGGGGGGGSR